MNELSNANDIYVNGAMKLLTEQARYPISNIQEMLDSEKYIIIRVAI